MRWTEIVDHAEALQVTPPTYRKMDLWTRQGKLAVEVRGDRRGRFRWWPPAEVEAALLVARLMDCGMDEELAFALARTKPARSGRRELILDGGRRPTVRVSIAAD